jgi:3-oxoacyl-[acyl-carrier protein] reductase
MKVLLIGGTGGIGKKLQKELEERRYEVTSVGSDRINLKDVDSIEFFFEAYKPEVVIFLSTINIDGFLHKTDLISISQQIALNVFGFTQGLQVVLRKMREQQNGVIIYASSILSKSPLMGTGIYSACKSYCETLVRVAALENANKNIRVSSIQMGYFDSGLSERIPKEILEKIIEDIPMRCLGKVEELANAVEFLINTEYATGMTLSLAGGLEAK